MGIMGELERAGHIDTSVKSVAGRDLEEVLSKWDYLRSQDPEVNTFFRAAMEALPAGEAWRPVGTRTRVVTRALKAYAAFATSADRGGFREI